MSHSTVTTAVHLTARELSILEGGLFELAENVVLHNKLKEALASMPSKHCLNSDNPKLSETHVEESL